MKVLVVGGHADRVEGSFGRKLTEQGLEIVDHWDGRTSQLPQNPPARTQGVVVIRSAMSHSHWGHMQTLVARKNLRMVSIPDNMSEALPILQKAGFVSAEAAKPQMDMTLTQFLTQHIMSHFRTTGVLPHERESVMAARKAFGDSVRITREDVRRVRSSLKDHRWNTSPKPTDMLGDEVIRPPTPLFPETDTMLQTSEIKLVRAFKQNPKWLQSRRQDPKWYLQAVASAKSFYTTLTTQEKETLRGYVRGETPPFTTLKTKLQQRLPQLPMEVCTILLLSATSGSTRKTQIVKAYKATMDVALGPYYMDVAAVLLDFKFADQFASTPQTPSTHTVGVPPTPSIVVAPASPPSVEVAPTTSESVDDKILRILLDLLPTAVQEQVTQARAAVPANPPNTERIQALEAQVAALETTITGLQHDLARATMPQATPTAPATDGLLQALSLRGGTLTLNPA